MEFGLVRSFQRLFPVLALSPELACNSGLQFHIISVHLVRTAG